MKNADASRARMLEAATAEFAAFGISGAQVHGIAKTGWMLQAAGSICTSRKNADEHGLVRNLHPGYNSLSPRKITSFAPPSPMI
jgi:hypothetical protein